MEEPAVAEVAGLAEQEMLDPAKHAGPRRFLVQNDVVQVTWG
jgi:hypothetical protein